ncbi:MAG: xanthine dehydrogenase family protein subunit M [Chloroflexi bacterium]|nr:xanthine dehydrogenase family protein subunit M [Chloroflexota bacterium]
MKPAKFDYRDPENLQEALGLLQQYGDEAKVLAGGQSLMPLMNMRLVRPAVILDINRLSELAYISPTAEGGLAIGGLTRQRTVEQSGLVRERNPLLAAAVPYIGHSQIRNRGTIGGSLAHADPAGDLPAVVLALSAQLTTSSAGGHRTIGADDFFVDLLTTALRPDEILSEITLPAPAQRTGSAYAKFANKASHFAVVGVAASVTLDSDGSCGEVRIGITGAGPKAVRATEAEAALRGSKPDDDAIRSAAERAGAGIDFNEDIHASGEYRAHLTTVYTERALKVAVSRAG